MRHYRIRWRKGVAAALVAALAALIIITVAWVVGGYITSYLFNYLDQDSIVQQYADPNTTAALKTAWDYWPLIALFAVILWLYYAAQRKEPIWEGQ